MEFCVVFSGGQKCSKVILFDDALHNSVNEYMKKTLNCLFKMVNCMVNKLYLNEAAEKYE